MDRKVRRKRNSLEVEGVIGVEEALLRRERQKARELRKTQWWRRRVERGICHYCNETYAAGDLTMDHVVPLARGGKSTKGNCVPCCKTCNTKKATLVPVEWNEYLDSLRRARI
jgi:5-methylcytosine-specific restriction endonuclease McrA